MAALDFPNAPAVNDLFTGPNGVIYQWTGTLWTVYGTVQPLTYGAAPTYDYTNAMTLDNTANVPASDVPMLITAGQPLFTRVFTANNPANRIEVDLRIFMGGGSAGTCRLALFIDGVSISEAVKVFNTSWNDRIDVYWQGVLGPGAHTFHARWGANIAFYLNGAQGARQAGGLMNSTMVIREVAQGIIGPQGVQGPPGVAGPAGGSGNWQTGDVIETYRSAADPGWVVMDDGTIGNTGSGGTTRANPDTQPLFNMFWPFAGCTIAGGKGASAAADWAALKAISIPKRRSRFTGGAGAGSGLTARNVGDALGSEITGPVNVGISFMGPPGGPAGYVADHQHAQNIPSAWVYFHLKL